jgi:hypothetical protein
MFSWSLGLARLGHVLVARRSGRTQGRSTSRCQRRLVDLPAPQGGRTCQGLDPGRLSRSVLLSMPLRSHAQAERCNLLACSFSDGGSTASPHRGKTRGYASLRHGRQGGRQRVERDVCVLLATQRRRSHRQGWGDIRSIHGTYHEGALWRRILMTCYSRCTSHCASR